MQAMGALDQGLTLRKEALAQWGDWLSREWDWSWWVTLTYDPRRGVKGSPTHGRMEVDNRTGERYFASVAGWSLSERHFHEWLGEALGDSTGATPWAGSVYWLRGREQNPWRYGTHFHALIGGVPTDVSRSRAWGLWFSRHGNARIEPYNPDRGAGWYVSKYVAKELGDIVFSPNMGDFAKGATR